VTNDDDVLQPGALDLFTSVLILVDVATALYMFGVLGHETVEN